MALEDLKSRPGIVLLSGGVDSATLLVLVRADGYQPYCLSVRYGQRHAQEINAAKRVAAAFGVVEHAIIELDLRRFGGSALTDDIEVPKYAPAHDIGTSIPTTYVPARNTIFLSLALAWAETVDARDIFIGVNAIDYSGYPDCRPEFINAFQELAMFATKAGVTGAELNVRTPLIRMTKADIIRKGLELGVDYALTLSCYDPDPKGLACGGCDACTLRRNGFLEVGIPDPTGYQSAAKR